MPSDETPTVGPQTPRHNWWTKIRASRVSGNCRQHQRDVAMAVKNSREMALLPYTSMAR